MQQALHNGVSINALVIRDKKKKEKRTKLAQIVKLKPTSASYKL